MQLRFAPAHALSVTLLALLSTVPFSAAQVRPIEPGTERPMFRRLPAKLHAPRTTLEMATTPLKTWNGSFSYNGKTYRYNMVGTAPSGGASTTVAVEIIPVKVVITSRSGVKTTYNPSHVLSNGNTATANTIASPLFKKISFTSGGVNMGTTQYIDAYQRANFWGTSRATPVTTCCLVGQQFSPSRLSAHRRGTARPGWYLGFQPGWSTSTGLTRNCKA